jgi:hypothetical protein
MSFVGERERGLILDLLRGQIREDDFYREFRIKPGEASSTGRAMLVRASQERDPAGVEFGLYLGHRFGVSEEYLDVLLGLACEPWHERHEDVIDALAKLKAPRSVEALYRTALTTFPYREYDEFNSLGTKCVRALGAIQTKEAIIQLGNLMANGGPILEGEAQAQLRRIEGEGSSEVARETAREILAARGGGEEP